VGSSRILSGTNAFTAPTSSFPGSVTAVAQEAIIATTGYKGNVCVCPPQTYDVLLNHPDVYKHGIGNSAQERLASVLQVPVSGLIVPTVRVNVGQEGQVNSVTAVWSTSPIVAYVPPATGPNVPSFLYTVWWNGPKVSPGGPPASVQVQQFADPEDQTHHLFGRYYADIVLTAPELSFLVATGV